MRCIYLTTDLMFSSRVTGFAEQAGLPLEVAATGDAAVEKAAGEPITLLLLDLVNFSGDLGEFVAAIRARQAGVHIVAYGPHVDEPALEAARQAGCDEVISRGQFHQSADQILRRCLEE